MPDTEPLQYGRQSRSIKRPLLYWLGFPIMVFGSAYCGAAISHELKNTVEGRHYYDWLAMGVVCFLVGFALMVLGMRRARERASATTTQPKQAA